MIRSIKKRFFRSAKDESGAATVEFILILPVYLSMMMFSIELGFVTMRHVLLERGLDIAVRDLRLGTGTFSGDSEEVHNLIKDAVCDNAILLADCDTQLRLEMQSANLFSYATLDQEVECTDVSQPATAVTDYNFNTGLSNELMLLRACYRFNALFPNELLGNLVIDATGQGAIVSTTAFVGEPG